MNRPKSESAGRARSRPSREWSATATTLVVAAAVIGCGSAEEPLQNTSQIQPISWEEFRASAVREPGPNGRFIVDGDIPLEDEAELREYYDSWTPPGALTVSQVFGSGEDNIWPFPSSVHLSYCIGSSTGANKAVVVAQMAEATKSWSAMAGVRFEYVPSEDASCNSSNNNVTFDVQQVPDDGIFAVSFFPDESRASRTLAIRPTAYTTTSGGRDFQGILRHELGHSLGFRHEHIWLNPACTGEQQVSGGYDARIVNSYDVDSVMHYPQCRPSGTGGYRQSGFDNAGAVELYHLSAQRIVAAIAI